jgi:MFS transporter, YNFM family, putative membrane transport protein
VRLQLVPKQHDCPPLRSLYVPRRNFGFPRETFPSAPDLYWFLPHNDRRRLAAVVLAGFCAFLGLHAPQPLLPLLQKVFRVPTSEVSLIITASTAAIAVVAPFIGLLADRWGRRNIIIPAALLLALPSLLSATATTFGQLLVWRILQGVCNPALSATTVAYVTEEWPEGAGTAMSAYVAGTILGGYAGRTLVALVGARYSWQTAFLLLGVLNLIGGFGVWAWLPRDRQKPAARPAHLTSSRGIIRSHLRNPALLATYLVGFCVLFSIIAAFTYINFRLSAPPYGWSTAALGFLFTAYLAAAAFTMVSGRSMNRWGYRATLILSLGLSTAGILLTLLENVPAILLGLTVFSCGIFVAQAAGNSYVGVAAKHDRATAVGLYVTAYYIGGTFGGALPGYFWNRAGWTACVAFIVVSQAMTAILVGRFWRDRSRPVPHLSVAVE